MRSGIRHIGRTFGALVLLMAAASCGEPTGDAGGAALRGGTGTPVADGSAMGTPAAAPGTGPQPDGAAPGTSPVEAAKGGVRVVVRDFAGVPIAGARVVVLPLVPDGDVSLWPGAGRQRGTWLALPPWRNDDAPRAEVTTATDGRAMLEGIPAGTWRIAVAAEGRVRRAMLCRVEPGTVADVELLTEPGHALAGRVLTRDGAPVAGATVLAEFPGILPAKDDPGRAVDQLLVRTGADGAFRFDAVPETVVQLSCGPPGAWSSRAWPVSVPSVSRIDLRMESCGPIEGTLFESGARTPVADAAVVFEMIGWHNAQVTAVARTDAEGRYRIPVYPGEHVVAIRVHRRPQAGAPQVPPSGRIEEPRGGDDAAAEADISAAQVLGARQPPFRLAAHEATRLDLAVKGDAPERAAVRGVVRGPDGPVAGARVFLSTLDDATFEASEPLPWMSPTVTTDAEGRFRFPEAPARRFAVVVSKAAGLFQPGTNGLFDDDTLLDESRLTIVEADAERPADVTVTLLRGGRVTGRVLDEHGRPVAGARVNGRGGVEAVTRNDGTFALEGLDEPEESEIYARTDAPKRAGRSARFVHGAGRDAEGVEIRLEPDAEEPRERPRVVTGTIVLPEGAVPAGYGRAELWTGWVPLPASGPFRAFLPVQADATEVTFRIVVPGAGSCEVTARGAANAESLDAGRVTIAVTPTLHGRVLGPDGPLAGAEIRIEVPRNGIGCGFFEDPQATVCAVSGDDGSFVARTPDAESLDVEVTAPGYIEETGELISSQFEFGRWDRTYTLVPEAFLTCSVTRRGGRPVDAEVVARPVGKTDPLHDWREEKRGDRQPDGTYRIRVKAGGEYEVSASPEDDDSDRFVETKSGPHVAGGDPVAIVVNEGGMIAGRVVDGAGHAVAGVTVTCDGPMKWSVTEKATTTDDGAFVFSALASGPCDITVSAGLEDPVVLEDVEFGRTDVEFRLPPGSVVEGTLLDATGNPAGRQQLVARPMERDTRDDRSVQTMTSADGRFRLTRVGRGPLRIELASGRRGMPWQSGCPLVGGANVAAGARDVVLRVPPDGATTVAGRVVDDRGAPFRAFVLEIRTSERVQVHHSGRLAGNEFSAAGLRLDEPCRMTLNVCGLQWKLEAAPGTHDVEMRCGDDGLHGVTMAGKAVERLPLALRFADSESVTWRTEIRLVHPVSGAVIAVPGLGPASRRRHMRVWESGGTQTHEAGEVPPGPWRVETRDVDGDAADAGDQGDGSSADADSGGGWHPCTVVEVEGRPALRR